MATPGSPSMLHVKRMLYILAKLLSIMISTDSYEDFEDD